jgi:alanine racemase
MPRPIQAFIHTKSLEHNLWQIKQAVPNSKVFSVVKARAYGHGLERVYKGLKNTDGFALLDLEEAAILRQLGFTGPILLLEGIFNISDLPICEALYLWQVVHHQEQVEMLKKYQGKKPTSVFLKLNSGMNRLGFRPQAYKKAWAELKELSFITEIVHMTHFADADKGFKGIKKALDCFSQTIYRLPGKTSICNSAATLHAKKYPTLSDDWVRVGISTYGSSPDYPYHSERDWGLQPAMSLRSKIIAIQNITQGETVGYGSTFVASEDMRIGIVACGYADGYLRHTGTGNPILVKDTRTVTVGRMSMDMLAVDLTPIPDTQIGTEVTLWGYSSTGSTLPIDEVATSAGTIAYELMCGLTPRVPVFQS